MKNKDFVEYQEALELKQLGFNEPCFGSWEVEKTNIPTYTHSVTKFYKNSDHPTGKTSAPTYSQAFRWFREKYGHHFQPFVDDNQTFGYLITYFTDEGRIDKPIKRGFKTPEEAELVCLRQLIEILKEKNK